MKRRKFLKNPKKEFLRRYAEDLYYNLSKKSKNDINNEGNCCEIVNKFKKSDINSNEIYYTIPFEYDEKWNKEKICASSWLLSEKIKLNYSNKKIGFFKNGYSYLIIKDDSQKEGNCIEIINYKGIILKLFEWDKNYYAMLIKFVELK